MGDRGQVKIIQWGDKPVYLYTHYFGSELVETVKKALQKKWRWNDGPYLTRIIFCEMVMGYEDEEIGFGISSGECDHYVSVNLHVKNQTVEVVRFGEIEFEGSFEDFIIHKAKQTQEET